MILIDRITRATDIATRETMKGRAGGEEMARERGRRQEKGRRKEEDKRRTPEEARMNKVNEKLTHLWVE